MAPPLPPLNWACLNQSTHQRPDIFSGLPFGSQGLRPNREQPQTTSEHLSHATPQSGSLKKQKHWPPSHGSVVCFFLFKREEAIASEELELPIGLVYRSPLLRLPARPAPKPSNWVASKRRSFSMVPPPTSKETGAFPMSWSPPPPPNCPKSRFRTPKRPAT